MMLIEVDLYHLAEEFPPTSHLTQAHPTGNELSQRTNSVHTRVRTGSRIASLTIQNRSFPTKEDNTGPGGPWPISYLLYWTIMR
jgi:hypothetical protein